MSRIDYSELFKRLIKAYYEDVFEKTVEETLSVHGINKEKLAKVISALCGVEVEYSNYFSDDLKEAIEHYKLSNRTVITTQNCLTDCIEVDGKTICQNACPFDAIILGENNLRVDVNIDNCVGCGICVDLCEKHNFLDKVEFMPLLNLLKENQKVIAVVAPAIVGQFGEDVSVGQIRAGLRKLGFADMAEVAFFADMLTIKEAVEFNRFVIKEKDFMLSSCCCPIWVGMIKNKYDKLIKYTSPSVSPMIAAGKVIKEINRDCKVVFIGPCVAKKGEAKLEDLRGIIDFVLTFNELKDIFDVLDIKLEEMHEELSTQYASKGGRKYGRIGGVSLAVKDAIGQMFPDKLHMFSSEQASGIKESRKMLTNALKGKTNARFLEGMGCDGGCVGGPKAIISKEKGREMIEKYGNESKVEISSKNKIMTKFLKELGIDSIEDFNDKSKVAIFERKL